MVWLQSESRASSGLEKQPPKRMTSRRGGMVAKRRRNTLLTRWAPLACRVRRVRLLHRPSRRAVCAVSAWESSVQEELGCPVGTVVRVPKGPSGPGTTPAPPSTLSEEVTLLAPSPEEGGQGQPQDADLAPAGVPASASCRTGGGVAKSVSPALPAAAQAAEPALAAAGAKSAEPPSSELPAKGSSRGRCVCVTKAPTGRRWPSTVWLSPSWRQPSLRRNPPGVSLWGEILQGFRWATRLRLAVLEPDYCSAGRSSDEEDRADAASAAPRPPVSRQRSFWRGRAQSRPRHTVGGRAVSGAKRVSDALSADSRR